MAGMSGNETKILGRARKARIVAGICAGIAGTMRQRDPGRGDN